MKQREHSGWGSALLFGVLCVVAVLAGLSVFIGNYKGITLLFAAAAVILIFTGRTDYLRHPVSLLLLGYVAVAGLSGIWAISGKFFLKEYAKIFMAACMFIGVLTVKRFNRNTVRTLFGGMTVVSGIYSFMNIEFVTTGILRQLIESLLPNMSTVNYYAEGSTRVAGVFGAPNAMATFVAFAIFFAVALLVDEEKKGLRLCWAAALAVNVFAFLTMFSLAGTIFFAFSVVVYLLCAGKTRGAVLSHMLIGAIPSVVWVAVSFSFFGKEGSTGCIPLMALLGNMATVMALELLLGKKLLSVLEKYGKLAFILLLAAVVAFGGFLAVALKSTEAYTFETTNPLQRAIYPAPGIHTLRVEAIGEVKYSLQIQNEENAIMGTRDIIYNGSETEITFEIPEDSRVCHIYFYADPGTVLEQVLLDDTQQIPLKYTMLPEFVVSRLQGFWTNQSVIQRIIFFDDGMELVAQAPVLGLGVGSFETALTSVQEHHYETKYIHNHYIQVLQECGILGFVPYMGALLGLVFLLWKQRKKEYPIISGGFGALCAAMAMMLTHTTFEFSMSLNIFVCFAFITFGIIIRCALEPVEETAEEKQEKKTVYQATKADRIFGVACAAFVVAFSITLGLNMYAVYTIGKPIGSEADFMENLITAAKIDPYEKNDAMLSYVVSTARSKNQDHYQAQADQYAERLMQVHSNTIPSMLTQYYLFTNQPYKALEAAQTGARYSATDSDKWNESAYIFRETLFRSSDSLLFQEGKPLNDGLLTYYETLQQHNAESRANIELITASKDFFSKVLSISEGDASEQELIQVLAAEMFQLSTTCDADQDYVPDQVSQYENVTFNPDKTMSVQEDAWMSLDLYSEYTGTMQMMFVCDDPESVYVASNKYLTVTKFQPKDGRIIINAEILEIEEDGKLPIHISFKSSQNISQIKMIHTS